MERDLKLKQFAGALFSNVYREYNSTVDLPVKLPHVFNQHAAGECSEDEGKAVMKLCLSLREVFSGPFTKAFPQIQKSVKHYMTFLTSRCLKLCGDDLFLSFVMISAFIAELNFFCWINGCYTFMNTAPKCLIAIFNRRMKKEFYACGGWEKLREFCENFVQTNGNGVDHTNLPSDDTNGDFINQSLLSSIEELLGENSSSEEDSSSSDSESSDEMEASNVEESEQEVAPEEPVHSEESSEESASSVESEGSESEESTMEVINKPNAVEHAVSSDEDSESSEDSDPSSMSDDEGSESESQDSESDGTPSMETINSLKPIMQENLSIEKKIL